MQQTFNLGLFQAVLFLLICWFHTAESCTAFYCLNSCGTKQTNVVGAKQGGFKLIVAVNRDEQVDRPTLNAGVWPPKNGMQNLRLKTSKLDKTRSLVECDQSKMEPPYNLCVYGPLDVAGKRPPIYYSTWLGII